MPKAALARPPPTRQTRQKGRLNFLYPSYSPELNPDEMANADIKQAVTKLAPARTKLQLAKATAKHLRSVQRQPERIRKYFEHATVRYAA